MLAPPKLSSEKRFCFLLLPVLLLLQLSAGAQLCTGALGDPVININFSEGRPLNQTSTDYTYTTAECPNDGAYTIRRSTSQCHGNTWHTLTSDHTGDGGYFMMVNASFTPGNFFVQTISGLCANTTYEFAAWMLNLVRNNLNSILPNITFRIESKDGTVLQTYHTGDIPVTDLPQWKQYGFFFKTPDNATEVVLKMINNAPGGIGNDLLLDDITFRPCGPSLQASASNPSDTIRMCEESSYPLSFTAQASDEFENPVFYWQQSRDSGATWQDLPGANSTTFYWQPQGPGAYWYRLSAAERQNSNRISCRVASNNIYILVHPTPAAVAGPDKIIIKGMESRLGGAPPQAGMAYTWTPDLYLDSVGSTRPRIRPQAETNTKYILTATSAFGCSQTDTVMVQVVERLHIPNAFTPNGDGHNDVWRIPFLDPELDATVMVYNRYGQQVYYCRDATVAWDGRHNQQLLPAGTYVYMIKMKHLPAPLTGTIQLLR